MANAEHEEQPCCIILDYSYRQNMEMGVPKINRIHTGDTGVSKWLNIYVQKTTPVGYNEVSKVRPISSNYLGSILYSLLFKIMLLVLLLLIYSDQFFYAMGK